MRLGDASTCWRFLRTTCSLPPRRQSLPKSVNGVRRQLPVEERPVPDPQRTVALFNLHGAHRRNGLVLANPAGRDATNGAEVALSLARTRVAFPCALGCRSSDKKGAMERPAAANMVAPESATSSAIHLMVSSNTVPPSSAMSLRSQPCHPQAFLTLVMPRSKNHSASSPQSHTTLRRSGVSGKREDGSSKSTSSQHPYPGRAPSCERFCADTNTRNKSTSREQELVQLRVCVDSGCGNFGSTNYHLEGC